MASVAVASGSSSSITTTCPPTIAATEGPRPVRGAFLNKINYDIFSSLITKAPPDLPDEVWEIHKNNTNFSPGEVLMLIRKEIVRHDGRSWWMSHFQATVDECVQVTKSCLQTHRSLCSCSDADFEALMKTGTSAASFGP